jgi:glycosyltransferase 2 family protein
VHKTGQPAPGREDRGTGAGAGTGRRRLWWGLVSTALAAVLVYLACRGVDWGRVLRTISGARWQYLAAAGAVTSGSFFLRAIRWRILLNAEARLDIGTVFWANMAGYLGNNFLPARAGELVRTVLISGQSRLSKAYVLTTALGERLMDVIALVLGSSLILLGIEPKPQWMEDLSRTMAFGAAAAAVAVVVLPHSGRLAAAVLGKLPLPPAIRSRLAGFVEQVLLGLKAFHNWTRLTGFILLTVVIWLADAVTAMTVGHALGLSLSLSMAFLLLTGLGLGSALPSTPGYVGVYQFAAVTILTPFGFSRDAALAYILVAQALGYVVVLIWGLPGLYHLRRSPK